MKRSSSVYLQMLRRLTPEERLWKAFELTEFSKQLFIQGLRQRFADVSPKEFQENPQGPSGQMSQPELLKKVIETLDSIGIDYMVTGSVASSLQGEPRASHDIDIVIAIQAPAIPKLLKHFSPPDYYLDEESVRSALEDQHMFNLIDVAGGDKVDFWLLTDEPFDRSRFSRKYAEEFMGMKMNISRPEDSILMKLRWARLSGGSEKQFIDALRIYEVQFKNLDISYIETWAKTLKIESLWARVKSDAQVM